MCRVNANKHVYKMSEEICMFMEGFICDERSHCGVVCVNPEDRDKFRYDNHEIFSEIGSTSQVFKIVFDNAVRPGYIRMNIRSGRSLGLEIGRTVRINPEKIVASRAHKIEFDIRYCYRTNTRIQLEHAKIKNFFSKKFGGRYFCKDQEFRIFHEYKIFVVTVRSIASGKNKYGIYRGSDLSFVSCDDHLEII